MTDPQTPEESAIKTLLTETRIAAISAFVQWVCNAPETNTYFRDALRMWRDDYVALQRENVK